jgi:hypothetical protein
MTIKIYRNGYEFQVCSDNPFLRFKGSKAKAPAPIAPVPTPKELDENVLLQDRDRRRQKIAQAGRAGTILTQGQPLTKATGTILGRSSS